MNMKKILNVLFKEVILEAESNPEFRARLAAALGQNERIQGARTGTRRPTSSQPKRPTNRRAPAVLDPVHLAKQGDEALRAALERLDIEQLRDVVAEYGMDTGKLVTKWRSADRIIDRITEVARLRAQKGSAFRDPPTSEPPSEPAAPGGRVPPEESQ